MSTDPMPAFLEVKDTVEERAQRQISWDRTSDACCCELNGWVEETLENSLDIDDVIHVALFNNPKLKAVYEDLGIAQAQLVQSCLLKNPIFGISVRFEKLVESASIIEMGLVQNFLDLLLKPLKIRMARDELEFTKTEVAAHVLDVIAEAKMAFFTMRAAEMKLNLTKDGLAAREAAYDAFKRLHEAGNVTDLALSLELSAYEKMKVEVSNAELEVIEAKEGLNSVMGLLGACLDWKLSEEDPVVLELDIDASCIETHVIAHSLDLKMARQKMRVTALGYGISTTEIVFPELMIGPDSERDPGEPWFVGPEFSVGIPLFDVGTAKRAEARAELSKQWNAYLALAVQVRSFSRLAAYRLQNALKQYRHYQNAIIPLEEKITSETLRQFNAMQLGVIELLITKQQEIETKLRSISFYRDYWIARTEVELLLSGRMIPRGM